MEAPSLPGPPPSEHVLALAGVDLVAVEPPLVRAEEAREVAVVLSRSRDPAREVHLDRCRQDGVPVVLRPSGGGAVVLAPGVVAASALLATGSEPRFPEAHFRRFAAAVSAALAECGVGGVVSRGISDLCLGERKIAGSALRVWRDRVLFQVAVLVDPDIGLLERYLAMPSRQPDYRRGRGHREFVTTLREAGHVAPAGAVAAAIRAALAAAGEAPPVLHVDRACV